MPLDPAALAGHADVVFLALPEAASAELAPVLLDAGVRVIDLSGAFRLRDEAARARWYPATKSLPDGRGLRPDRVRVDGDPHGARCCRIPGCYPTASLLALLPLQRAGLLLPGADIVIDAKSGISGAGKAPYRAHALLGEPRQRRRLRPVRPSPHARDGAGARPQRDVRAAPGAARPRHPVEPLRAAGAGHDRRRAVAAAFERAYADAPFVRLTGEALPEIKHVAHTNFCDIGWKVDEADGPRVRGQRDRQPGEGRRRPGRAELQRDVRPRREGRACCEARPSSLKLGGELLESPDRAGARSARSIAAGRRSSGRWSSCTAAAARSTRRWRRSAFPKRQVDGLRVTDDATLDVVVSVLAGSINTRFVAAINAAGGRAVGLTGADAGVAPVKKAAPHKATSGDTRRPGPGRARRWPPRRRRRCSTLLCEAGYVPVIACVGASKDGQLFNVNADTLAGSLAARLKAKRLVIAGAHRGRARQARPDDPAPRQDAHIAKLVDLGHGERGHGRQADAPARPALAGVEQRGDRRRPRCQRGIAKAVAHATKTRPATSRVVK